MPARRELFRKQQDRPIDRMRPVLRYMTPASRRGPRASLPRVRGAAEKGSRKQAQLASHNTLKQAAGQSCPIAVAEALLMQDKAKGLSQITELQRCAFIS